MLAFLLLSPGIHADGESVPLRSYLEQLGGEQGFTISGLTLVSAGDALAPSRSGTLDARLSRALKHYNFVVSYRDNEVAGVAVLGRKGASTGPAPEDTPLPDTPLPDAPVQE